MTYALEDCCVYVVLDADKELVLEEGDVDPFSGEEVGWPAPRIYWSNGTITEGAVT
jgi:hypothetical protein